jgi:hypothetical protein
MFENDTLSESTRSESVNRTRAPFSQAGIRGAVRSNAPRMFAFFADKSTPRFADNLALLEIDGPLLSQRVFSAPRLPILFVGCQNFPPGARIHRLHLGASNLSRPR